MTIFIPTPLRPFAGGQSSAQLAGGDPGVECEVEDDCPGCGERHITPIESEDQKELFKFHAVTCLPGAVRS